MRCQPYTSVFGEEIDWVQNDAGAFTKPDADLLEELGEKHGVSNVSAKTHELEVSMDGLQRKGMSDKIHVLTQDWEDFEILITREQVEKDGGYQEEIDRLQAELDELNRMTSERSSQDHACDFRSYGGYHEVDLTPRTRYGAERPIVLFGGLNGAGKTTLLLGVKLALYGRQALGLGTTKTEYESFIDGCIHQSNYALVGLIARMLRSSLLRQARERLDYRVRRSWVKDGKTTRAIKIWNGDEELNDLSQEAQVLKRTHTRRRFRTLFL